MDRQFCPRVRFRIRISVVVRVDAVRHDRILRTTAEDRSGVGLFSVGRRDVVRAGGSVLRGAGVRVCHVRILHVFAVRSGAVRVPGRARETAGWRMTARGPAAVAHAARVATHSHRRFVTHGVRSQVLCYSSMPRCGFVKF